LTYDTIRQLGLALPGMEDGTSYGTPALKVCGRFVCRLREDGETLALRIGFWEREELMTSDPETFFITPHYQNYPAVVVRLHKARRALMGKLLLQTWRELAPKSLVASFDKTRRK
jgi:hypothetical protein